MLGTLVVAAVEVSVITLEASTAILMQLQNKRRYHDGIRSEADVMGSKFVALQRAFTDALSDPTQAKTGRDLRSIIRSNYEHLLAEELVRCLPNSKLGVD
jgi:hypothetical protein